MEEAAPVAAPTSSAVNFPLALSATWPLTLRSRKVPANERAPTKLVSVNLKILNAAGRPLDPEHPPPISSRISRLSLLHLHASFLPSLTSTGGASARPRPGGVEEDATGLEEDAAEL